MNALLTCLTMTGSPGSSCASSRTAYPGPWPEAGIGRSAGVANMEDSGLFAAKHSQQFCNPSLGADIVPHQPPAAQMSNAFCTSITINAVV